MNKLQFRFNISGFFLEKLKFAHLKKNARMMQLEDMRAQPPISPPPPPRQQNSINNNSLMIEVCPNCHEKMKRIEAPIKDGELICKYCDNKNICKIYDKMMETKGTFTDIIFDCKYFMPDRDMIERV